MFLQLALGRGLGGESGRGNGGKVRGSPLPWLGVSLTGNLDRPEDWHEEEARRRVGPARKASQQALAEEPQPQTKAHTGQEFFLTLEISSF